MYDTSAEELLRRFARWFFVVCGGTLLLILGVVVLVFVEMSIVESAA